MSDTPHEELPAGYAYTTVRTTYLEMIRPEGERPTAALTPTGLQIARWPDPPLEEYRELFRQVGGPWGWTGRLLLSDEALRAVISDPRIEIWRIGVDGQTAGFIELDARVPGEVEIAYFGFRPGFTGRGLGGEVLRWSVDHVWSMPDVERYWLHTCDLDHPRALAVYQRAGFRIIDEHVGPEAYPEAHLATLRRQG
jgi:RimJ/RimL family protein N-acetyltransferase